MSTRLEADAKLTPELDIDPVGVILLRLISIFIVVVFLLYSFHENFILINNADSELDDNGLCN
jgi:hypothetical protein